MQPFLYERAGSLRDAIGAARKLDPGSLPPVQAPGQFIAGGTNMSDYMKLGVMQPQMLVDINHAEDQALRRIELTDRGLRLGALVRMAEAEDHEGIRKVYPVVADTLKLAASRQIRNMASLGGNILQRTRCEYFRETSWPCNKRNPGSGCSALGGVNRQHAILGTSDNCIATYHGDFAQALVALDATVEISGPNSRTSIPFAQLHRQPGDTPNIETVLAPGDLITAIVVPAGPWTARSHYLKIRDRQSYAFALASVAVALDMDGDTVREAHIALGGVATVPWRAIGAEEALRGKPINDATAAAAAEAAFADARTFEHNAFKLTLGRNAVIRALFETRDMVV